MSKLIHTLTPTNIGGTAPIDVEAGFDTVHIKPSGSITLSSAYNITVSGTPIANTAITFMYGGNITTDTSTGKVVTIFGTALTDAQALYEGEITAYYDGSAWEIKIYADAESGLSNLDGGSIVTGSIATAAIADDAVTNDKLNSMTRGTIKRGGTGNVPEDYDAKTSGQILIGDGTDIKSVAVSGDVTISASGVTTIGAGKVTNAMLATPPQTYYVLKRKFTPAEIYSMYATPITLLSAPGANKAYNPFTGYIWVDFNSAAYTGGGTVELRFGSDTQATAAVGSITTGSDLLTKTGGAGGSTTGSLNQALTITNLTGAFATGDSDVYLVLYYAIEDFNF